MNLLKGKNVIITGGSRGIGRGIAEKFAQNGANIAFTCSKLSASSSELCENIEELGVKVKAYASDASDYESALKLADDVINDFGSIDVLVNNAGITKDNLLMRMSEEDFDKVMKVNMNSVFNNTKAVLRPMLKQKSGSIINLSSVVGVKGNPGQSNYSASKAAIIGFTKSIALELGSRNIRWNAIAPGFPFTPTTELKLIIEPDFCFNMRLKTALVLLNTEFIFTFITLSKSSSLILISRLSLVIPALFTKTSILPKSLITSSASFKADS
jgi:3-oxoacyl-[acyl-carrier protein] reductase